MTAPDELLDLIYADSSPPTISFADTREHRDGVWHRPTVQAAARLTEPELAALEAALRADELIGDPVGSYGTLTTAGENRARQRWHATRPVAAFGGPPRLARPYRRAGSVVARREDRSCPNCGAFASWLTRKSSKRWTELRDRGEADYTCTSCDARWTIYLEATGSDGSYQPLADARVCRPRWRYRGGWLNTDALAPPDHHPSLSPA